MLIDKEVMYRGHMVKYENLKKSSKLKLRVLCDKCGKEFTSTKYQLERNGHQYCQACALNIKEAKYLNPGDKYGRLTVIGPGSKAGYSICECECGTTREFYNYGLTSGTTRSCGCLQRDLASEHFKKLRPFQVGENHPNWKGGVTDERHNFESSKEFKNIRDINRNMFCCMHCASKDNIVIHHIIGYSKDPSKFLDPNNIVPLCEKCHRKYHHLYGFKGGEKEFNEFLNTLIDPLE